MEPLNECDSTTSISDEELEKQALDADSEAFGPVVHAEARHDTYCVPFLTWGSLAISVLVVLAIILEIVRPSTSDMGSGLGYVLGYGSVVTLIQIFLLAPLAALHRHFLLKSRCITQGIRRKHEDIYLFGSWIIPIAVLIMILIAGMLSGRLT